MNAVNDLNGVRGKAFHVDIAQTRYELLTETLIDPKTDEGKSRHTVSWGASTAFTRVVRQKSFKGLTGPVWTEFHNIGEKHADAIEKGEPFRCKFVRVLSQTDTPHGLSEDRRSLVGLFTPDPESPKHRDGVITFGDTSIKASLPGPHGEVDVYAPTDANTFGQGFWETQIWGKPVDGTFHISRMHIHPLPNPRETDDPKLPRVLVVGDSISMNYHDAAKKALQGIANYHRVEGNAGPSDRGVTCMELWLGDYAQEGLGWDLIQFNHGLHDLKQFYDEDTKTYGDHQLDIAAYKANLEQEIAIMRKTGATLMWCSTTPVPNSSVGYWSQGTMGRQKDEDRVFNTAAREVMARHPDILINDLNRAVREAAETSEHFVPWRKGTDVHFWHGPQQEIVGKAVAEAVKQALAERPAP